MSAVQRRLRSGNVHWAAETRWLAARCSLLAACRPLQEDERGNEHESRGWRWIGKSKPE